MTESVKPDQANPDQTNPEQEQPNEVVMTTPVAPPPVETPLQMPEQAPVKTGKGLSIVAILLSLTAIGGTGYSLYTSEVQGRGDKAVLAVKINEIGGSVSRLGDSISRLQSEQQKAVSQEQLSTRLLQSSSKTDLQFRDVKQSQSDLFGAVAKINGDLNRGVNDFVVTEVSQLLKLANNSALFSNDTQSAIKALQLADIQLKELSDPRYSKVRQKINQEIALLENIEQVDIDGVSVKLKSLADRIPSLALENDVPTVSEVVITTVEKSPGFKGFVKEVWADIVDLNSIHRVDQAPKPLLIPEQRYFLNQNIQLQLAKAELGLLQNREATYQESLAAAMGWLNEYFDLRDDSVKQTLSQLGQLKSLSLSNDVPSISGSYSELQAIRGGQ